MPILTIQPGDKKIEVSKGTALQDILFELGVEFPCGGKGLCRKCKVRVLEGQLATSPDHDQLWSDAERQQGWYLACRSSVTESVTLEIEQWQMSILTDSSRVAPLQREGLAAVVDLGTTTLAIQLIDMRTGVVMAVRSALNQQGQFGADIMSRIEYGLEPHNREQLTRLIRNQIGGLLLEMLSERQCNPEQIRSVTLVGNTAMHHLFGNLDVTPLSRVPFETSACQQQKFDASELDWPGAPNAEIRFLNCLGGFVGSDILAGILATQIQRSSKTICLIDLGTNGEIVIGNRDRILCASTAAGPAFEGAKIEMGMRATTGAISAVRVGNDLLDCDVIGGGEARGICGSGLVDAVAAGLQLGWIEPSGRIADGSGKIALTDNVQLTQQDIRELQVAKAAIAAGVEILQKELGIHSQDVHSAWLAGAFGNYIRMQSAVAIGLLPFPAERIEAAGNTALRGAKMSLANHEEISAIIEITEHLALANDPEFQDVYVDNMHFPHPD